MRSETILMLNKIVEKKSHELGFQVIKSEHSGTVISMLREDCHLFIEMRSSVVPSLPLQMSIYTEDSAIRMIFFPSPSIIKSENVSQFIYLSNTANSYLYRGTALGRFWVDKENFDFVYEVILKENMLEHCTEEVSRQLFDIPCAHYKDLHIPLAMLKKDTWEEDTAIRYLTELRENGYVDNLDYGLW